MRRMDRHKVSVRQDEQSTPAIIIGIDPDVHLYGVARLEVASRAVELKSLPLPLLLDYLVEEGRRATEEGYRLVVVVEASWQTSGNWHLTGSERGRIASAKGYSVGRNHQAGLCLCLLARHKGLEVEETPPLRKLWRGKDKKITHGELCAFVHLPGRSNQEERDACLLAWRRAGLPVRLSAYGKPNP